MINQRLIYHSVLFVSFFLFSLSHVHAQQSQNYDDGFRMGASLNYGGIYFESDGNILNDFWTNSFGYQFHVLYGFRLSTLFSLNTGATLFTNRYKFVEQRSPVFNDQGESTGEFISTSMTGAVGTTYVGLPVNLIVRPIANKSFYVTVGPEISFKVAHSNGTIKSVWETDSDEENEVLFQDVYDFPERSNNPQLFVNVGFGYSFDEKFIPLNIELGAKQAVTLYMSGDNFISSWIRSFSVTLSCRL